MVSVIPLNSRAYSLVMLSFLSMMDSPFDWIRFLTCLLFSTCLQNREAAFHRFRPVPSTYSLTIPCLLWEDCRKASVNVEVFHKNNSFNNSRRFVEDCRPIFHTLPRKANRATILLRKHTCKSPAMEVFPSGGQ